MTILWQNTTAIQAYKLGEHLPAAPGTMPSQAIDFVWSEGGHDNIGYIRSPDHAAKIVVFGPDCVDVATRIVEALNAGR